MPSAFETVGRPIQEDLAATGSSSTFLPRADDPFNISVWGTWVGSIIISRSFDAGVNWVQLTNLGAPISFTANFTEVCVEPESGVLYRATFTRTSGTATVRFSQ